MPPAGLHVAMQQCAVVPPVPQTPDAHWSLAEQTWPAASFETQALAAQ
jgi:hypothetical protein